MQMVAVTVLLLDIVEAQLIAYVDRMHIDHKQVHQFPECPHTSRTEHCCLGPTCQLQNLGDYSSCFFPKSVGTSLSQYANTQHRGLTASL